MKKNSISIPGVIGILSLTLCLSACQQRAETQNASSIDTVLTKAEQSELSPDQVLAILKKGNDEFANGNMAQRNSLERVRDAVSGQHPHSVILSCLDSRVPVEDIFQCGIGDMFVARVAGNIVNEDILGSMEYACKVSGSKVVVVLGHGYCGAVKSAIDEVELGNITGLLSRIQPAVSEAKSSFEGEATSKNSAFVDAVCDHNVRLAMNEIRENSPILKEMEAAGDIKIVGGVYNMETGRVVFFE